MATEVGSDTPPEGAPGAPVPCLPAASTSFSDPGDAKSRGPLLRFFPAVVLSLYGDWLSTVALVVVLFQVTGTPAGPAGYVVARVAPRAFGPWLAGRLAVKVSARNTVIAASAVQTVFTASLIVSHRTGTLWAIYAAVAVAQFAGGLSRPSQGALLPSLVSDARLPRANATYALFGSTSIFVAPAIGAALLLRVGPDPLFAIDAATFALCAVLIASLPPVNTVTLTGARDRGLGSAPPRALLVALGNPEVRMVAAANFASGLSITVAQAFLVVAAAERFGGDASVGFLYSSVGVGGTIGGLVALRWVPPRRWTRFAVFTAVVAEIIALAGFTTAASIAVALLLLAVNSAGASSMDTWGATEVQRRAPPGLMVRFNSIIFISLYGGMLVGALWALGTARVLHWDVAIEYACAASLVVVGAVWISCGKSTAERGSAAVGE